jgi:hypothetical protein
MQVREFTLKFKIDKPRRINVIPIILADNRETFFVGKTLFFVLTISLSVSDSITLFITDDPVEDNNVPMIVKNKRDKLISPWAPR